MAVKRITVSIDEGTYRLARLDKRNASKYVAELIRRDMSMEHIEPLYNRFIARLLEDDETLSVLRGKLAETKSYVDWGA